MRWKSVDIIFMAINDDSRTTKLSFPSHSIRNSFEWKFSVGLKNKNEKKEKKKKKKNVENLYKRKWAFFIPTDFRTKSVTEKIEWENFILFPPSGLAKSVKWIQNMVHSNSIVNKFKNKMMKFKTGDRTQQFISINIWLVLNSRKLYFQ